MKIRHGGRVSEAGRPYFVSFNGDLPKKTAWKGVMCKYWLAGCCKNESCKFRHGDLPPGCRDYLKVKHKSAPKKWCRDMNAPQKKIATARVTGPSKPKATTPLKPKPTVPVKQRIIALLKQEVVAATNAQKKNLSAALGNKEAVSPNTQVEIYLEKVDNKKTTCPNILGEIAPQNVDRVCRQWILGNCEDAAKCIFLHSWFSGDGFTRMALLEGHEKAVTGIALPSGSEKLYTGSSDGTLRCWNRHTGQCTDVANLGAEIGSLFSEGPWLIVGIPNFIHAKNIETSNEYILQGPVGQVLSVIIVNDVIFAGAQDGLVLAWKTSSELSLFQPSATLLGHNKAVVSLAVIGNQLFTGSLDHTIKVWDFKTLQCLQTLCGHTDAVMSLLCFDRFLISCSLDQTIKIWAVNGDGKFEVTYTHKEDHGILALAGMNDSESKPILLCSCTDNSVQIYELPSFCDRGRLFAREEVRTIHTGPSGLIFTGEGSGCVAVWRLKSGQK
uniref:C3H1-type domain-containing protein n=2 Tax=Kalanchoe fedtschenkoi TaxID=63787 RepID=A0A7N0SVE5_KALFE